MKTLYISDLDGTLLNSDASLTNETSTIINSLIEKGMNFTFATARTTVTAIKMTEKINLSLPVILMNGVCIYDISKQKYINVELISQSATVKIIDILKNHNQTGFFYSIIEDEIYSYYENLDKPHMRSFHEERVRKFNKPFVKVNSFTDCLNLDILYYSMADKQEILEPLYNCLKQVEGIHIEYYRDIYEPDFWYMEICSDRASKYNAVQTIRKAYGFEQIIGFGDNLNDIPLFKASDMSYAVENAKSEVKNAATGVIGSNNDNGVADWLLRNFEV